MELRSPGAALFFLGLHRICIFGSLHRRNPGCHFPGLGAGQNENDAVWAVRIISNEDTDILDALKKKDMAADYYDNAVIAKSTEYGSYLGKFKLTAYCSCPICCGVWSGGPTASGAMPTIDHTVAMAGLPFGTELIINGQVYTVEDLGTPYGHVDIYMNNHQAALQFGVQYSDVYLKK